MHMQHPRILALGLLLLLVSCSKKKDTTPPPPPPVTTQTDIAAVDTKISNFLATYGLPGASLAVTKNGKLVYVKGYGYADAGAGEKVTPAHLFRLASVTKTYTAVAIMKLIQDGRLTLDGKVFGTGSILGSDYGTAPYNSNLLALTVRQLLQHTSGAWGANTGGDVIDQNPSYTNKQMLDWIINTRPMPAVPGTQFDYSNVNYFILGRIIEKISGKSYINFMKEDILNGLGITTTDMAGKTEAERKTNEVKYYPLGADAPYVYTMAFPRRDADGGLISTAKDLLKLVTAVDGFNTRPDMLNGTTLSAMVTPPSFNTSYACGMGLWSAENLWFDYGSLPGTRTGFMRHDNGLCVALLFNSRLESNTFVYAMQDLMLDIVKNGSYNWRAIDQF